MLLRAFPLAVPLALLLSYATATAIFEEVEGPSFSGGAKYQPWTNPGPPYSGFHNLKISRHKNELRIFRGADGPGAVRPGEGRLEQTQVAPQAGGFLMDIEQLRITGSFK